MADRTEKLTKGELLNLLHTMESDLAALKDENSRLQRKLTRRGRAANRSLLDDMRNREKAEELLSISVEDGALFRSTTTMYSNFQTFFSNVFRVLNPRAIKNARGGADYIRYGPFADASEHDYQIYKRVIEDCIDIIYEAKKELNATENIAPSAQDARDYTATGF